ncbi:MAG TPA: SDR family oxidoreductase, partial [Brevibacterium epidermidis]|nr:SDR family oxidoreductase [Brevibacterium epidermidis]
EYGRKGIRCNSVAPGPVESALTVGQSYDLSGQALDRMGQPAEIAEAVAYLATDGSAFTTGQILRVDGGAVMS